MRVQNKEGKEIKTDKKKEMEDVNRKVEKLENECRTDQGNPAVNRSVSL